MIYLINKTIQEEDSDGWHSWVTLKPISYHSSKELAEIEILLLLNGEVNSESFYNGAGYDQGCEIDLVYSIEEITLKS